MFQSNQLATPLQEQMKKAGGTSERSIPTCPSTRRHTPDRSTQHDHLTAQYAMSRHWHNVLTFPFDKSVPFVLLRHYASSVNSRPQNADTDGEFPCEWIGEDVEGVFSSRDVTFWNDGIDALQITDLYQNPGPSKCHPDAHAANSQSQTCSSTITFSYHHVSNQLFSRHYHHFIILSGLSRSDCPATHCCRRSNLPTRRTQ